jgi:hypothetical protein
MPSKRITNEGAGIAIKKILFKIKEENFFRSGDYY